MLNVLALQTLGTAEELTLDDCTSQASCPSQVSCVSRRSRQKV